MPTPTILDSMNSLIVIQLDETLARLRRDNGGGREKPMTKEDQLREAKTYFDCAFIHYYRARAEIDDMIYKVG